VIAQASSTTPTLVGATGAVGVSLKYARADHVHEGVISVNGVDGAVTGIATTAGNLSQFAATTSAQLASVISDETGTGSLVFASTPTLVTPVIGAATGTSLSVSGNVTTAGIALGTGNLVGGNITATHFGSGAGLSAITGANVTGTVPLATSATTATSATSATTAATVTTAAQPNITSVGTLTSVTVSGNITGGNLITAGLVSLSSITKTGSNGVGNIGAAASAFNTVFAKATSAQYADLAENYSADAAYAPGTVLDFGGENEVTLSATAGSNRVAGVVSTNPAYLMNSMLNTEHVVPIALTGRVPTRVVGPVSKGDMMVSAGHGQACASAAPALGSVIGKALVNFDGTEGIIEIVVGRM
jgi:hypothetical protein